MSVEVLQVFCEASVMKGHSDSFQNYEIIRMNVCEKPHGGN